MVGMVGMVGILIPGIEESRTGGRDKRRTLIRALTIEHVQAVRDCCVRMLKTGDERNIGGA